MSKFKWFCLSVPEEKDGLCNAVLSNDFARVIFWVEREGVDVNEIFKGGNTALHLAVENGFSDIVRYLIKKCDVDSTLENDNRQTALDLANTKIFEYNEKDGQRKYVRIAELLINHKEGDSSSLESMDYGSDKYLAGITEMEIPNNKGVTLCRGSKASTMSSFRCTPPEQLTPSEPDNNVSTLSSFENAHAKLTPPSEPNPYDAHNITWLFQSPEETAASAGA